MVVTISNNTITTVIGGVAHEVVGGTMVVEVEVEIMISRNHHQV